jgi:tRNA threonylcarbamoyladenosine biosynthesis protein TsaE
MGDRRTHTVQSPHVLDFISHSAAQTARFGQRLGELLQPGDLVLLLGEFGAGKTHFVKGVAQALGTEELVNSPSFVLINEYRAGPRHHHAPIYHIDLYRIEQPAELEGIGLEDALGGDGFALIEWAERAAGWLPNDHLAVHFQHLSDTKRVLRLAPHGQRYEELVAAFKKMAFA